MSKPFANCLRPSTTALQVGGELSHAWEDGSN